MQFPVSLENTPRHDYVKDHVVNTLCHNCLTTFMQSIFVAMMYSGGSGGNSKAYEEAFLPIFLTTTVRPPTPLCTTICPQLLAAMTDQDPLLSWPSAQGPDSCLSLRQGLLAATAALVCMGATLWATSPNPNALALWAPTTSRAAVRAAPVLSVRTFPHSAAAPRSAAHYAERAATPAQRQEEGPPVVSGQEGVQTKTMWAGLVLIAASFTAWLWHQQQRARLALCSAASGGPLLEVCLGDRAAAAPQVHMLSVFKKSLRELKEKKRKPLTDDPYGDEIRKNFLDWLQV